MVVSASSDSQASKRPGFFRGVAEVLSSSWEKKQAEAAKENKENESQLEHLKTVHEQTAQHWQVRLRQAIRESKGEEAAFEPTRRRLLAEDIARRTREREYLARAEIAADASGAALAAANVGVDELAAVASRVAAVLKTVPLLALQTRLIGPSALPDALRIVRAHVLALADAPLEI